MYGQIVAHTATYGVAALLKSVAAVLLLPIYTRYFSPAEYGTVAILDLTSELLYIVLGSGLTTAVIRFSDEANTRDGHDRVWGTALLYFGLAGAVALGLGLLLAVELAEWTLLSSGHAHLYRIFFVSFFVGMVGTVPTAYLIAHKKSLLLSTCMIVRCLGSIGVSVWFIVFLGWGIEGFLYAGLTVGVIFTVVTLGYLVRQIRLRCSVTLLGQMFRFATPLVPGLLCAAMMHEGDRFILQRYTSMADVGIYSLGYKIAMMTTFLISTPFNQAWSSLLYDVNRRSDAPATYAKILSLYVSLLTAVLVILAVFAREIVTLVTGPDFHDAHRVIPVVALGYVFYSMHDHLRVPSLLTKRTEVALVVYAVGAAGNLVLNLLLVPAWGYMGAAIATAASFALFAGAGFVCYRRLYRIPYSFKSLALPLASGIALVAALSVVPDVPAWLSFTVRALAVLIFVAGLGWFGVLKQSPETVAALQRWRRLVEPPVRGLADEGSRLT